VRVKFGRRPAGTPTLRLEPAHAVLESAHWDGNTLVAVYSGLHLSTRSQFVLQADYRSRINNVGHPDKRWTLTTQGYPGLSALIPAPDQPQAARVGKLSVDFSYRPPVEPRLTIVPADGTLLPGGGRKLLRRLQLSAPGRTPSPHRPRRWDVVARRVVRDDLECRLQRAQAAD